MSRNLQMHKSNVLYCQPLKQIPVPHLRTVPRRSGNNQQWPTAYSRQILTVILQPSAVETNIEPSHTTCQASILLRYSQIVQLLLEAWEVLSSRAVMDTKFVNCYVDTKKHITAGQYIIKYINRRTMGK